MNQAVSVELWRAPTPIPRPVLTAAGVYDTYFHLVAVARADGCEGWGYAGLPSLDELGRASAFSASLISGGSSALADLLGVERYGHDTASHAATCAIALAAWDLAGRLLGVGCADLWGRRRADAPLDCYASGLFLDAPLEGLITEAEAYRSQGYRYVKMRVGVGIDNDIERYRAVATVFPEPGAIAVDAFHSWTAADVRAFATAVGPDVLWIEDATPYGELAAVQPIGAPMASGESLETVAELLALHRDGALDYSLPDVMRLGGPQAWLGAAHALVATGARVGAHVFTPQSAHLLACIADPLPVEVFDWSDPLFVEPPKPGPDGRLDVRGPGFGVELDRAALERYGERIR